MSKSFFEKYKKNMVTNFSSLKSDLDHYGLNDDCNVFFKSLRPFFKNGHFKMSFFEKSQKLLKKTIHFTYIHRYLFYYLNSYFLL